MFCYCKICHVTWALLFHLAATHTCPLWWSNLNQFNLDIEMWNEAGVNMTFLILSWIPSLVSNETVPVHPAHLISILPAIARLLLIGWEIDMRNIHTGHYRVFILLFGLQMKRWWWAGAKTAIFNEREEPNMQGKLRVGRRRWWIIMRPCRARETYLLYWCIGKRKKPKGFYLENLRSIWRQNA